MKIIEMFSEAEIESRVSALAQEISMSYEGKELCILCVLKGAAIFACDLMRKLTVPCRLDFIRAKSYDGDCSTGKVDIDFSTCNSISGKHVLVVEDIVDTGRTLYELCGLLRQQSPASLKICTFLDKECRRVVGFESDYVGFDIPDAFVVGYGLDYNERFRELPFVAVLEL